MGGGGGGGGGGCPINCSRSLHCIFFLKKTTKDHSITVQELGCTTIFRAACAVHMHHHKILDIAVPRIIAGVRTTQGRITRLDCPHCT